MARNRQSKVIAAANAELQALSADYPNNSEAVQAVHALLEGILLSNGGYDGYNSRAWMTFTLLPQWHTIVRTLNERDQRNKTRHYWELLEQIEQGTHSPRYYFGSDDPFVATEAELAHCQAIHDQYLTAKGLFG